MCHKINSRGIFMVKANHLSRSVKGTLWNTKSVGGNFVTCTGGRYGGVLLETYGSTWNRGSNIKWMSIHFHKNTRNLKYSLCNT